MYVLRVPQAGYVGIHFQNRPLRVLFLQLLLWLLVVSHVLSLLSLAASKGVTRPSFCCCLAFGF